MNIRNNYNYHSRLDIVMGFTATVLLVIFPGIFFGCASPASQEETHLRYETFIPMRDGNYLSAWIMRPDDSGQYPAILVQTPYNKDGILYYFDNNEPIAVTRNYAYVIVDWRGFFDSADAGEPGYDQGLDGYDLVEWIAGQPWSDGKVGTWGVSALGAAQYRTMVKQPPHLVCSVPIFRSLNLTYQSIFTGGAYRKEYVETLDALGFGLSAFFKEHPTYDTMWMVYEVLYNPADIEIPVFVVAAWYDIRNETIPYFFDIKSNGGPKTRAESRLLVGSWIHFAAQDPAASIDPLTEQELLFYDQEHIIQIESMKFFDYHLRGIVNDVAEWAVVRYHDYAADTWETSDTWPLTGISTLEWYLQDDNSLAYDTPPENSSFSYSYTYDPDNPVPTIAGPTLNPLLPHGPHDLRLLELRADVISFASPVLPSDLVTRGEASVGLYVSSDCVDTDFDVFLTDVFPDGTCLFIAQGTRRLKFRDSYEDPVPAVSGTVYFLDIALRNDLCYTFKAGHRIKLLVTSSNYPLHDKNSNNGDDFSGENPPNIASNQVWVDETHRSYLLLPAQ